MTSIDYDDPNLWGSGAFFKFSNPGDKISGNIVEVTVKHWDATDDSPAKQSPVFHLEQNDGSIIEVTISHSDLKKQIREMRPQIGQWIGIKFNRTVGKVFLFDVVINAGRPAGTTVSRTPAADVVAVKEADKAALGQFLDEAPF